MSSIVIVAAEVRELAGVSRFAEARPLRWPLDYSGVIESEGTRLLLVANGAGARNAALAVEAAAGRDAVDAVVSTGYCGGLDPALRAGEVFVAREVRDLAGGERYAVQMPVTSRSCATGVLVTSDRVVCTSEEKRRLNQTTGASAVDMEAAAVAAQAARRGLPFFCVRVVSDTADESFAWDLNAMRDSEGRFQRGRILRETCRRPLVMVPELVRLYRRSRMASGNLGEFLASCRF